MPELPEVEAARRLVDGSCVGKRIVSCTIADDTKVIVDITPEELQRSLVGNMVVATHRKGKHLWLEFDGSNPALMFHFGMTGAMVVQGVGASKYKRFSVDSSEWPPRFWKVQLEMEGGVKLGFTDARRFARVQSMADPPSQPPISKMGPDCLLELPDAPTLLGMLCKKRGALKSVLMDQSVLAGIGNWVADEVLYQARLHPETPANTLDEEAVGCLRDAILYVCETAVEADADSDNFPRDWIFHNRWSKGSSVSVAGKRIEFIEVGGRTTAFVPALQKKSSAATTAAKPKGGGRGEPVAAAATDMDLEGAKGEGEVDAAPSTKPAAAKGGRGKKATAQARDEGAAKPVNKRAAAKPSRAGRGRKTAVEEDSGDEAESDVEGSAKPAGKSRSGKRKTAPTAAEGGEGDKAGKGAASKEEAAVEGTGELSKAEANGAVRGGSKAAGGTLSPAKKAAGKNKRVAEANEAAAARPKRSRK